MSAHLNKDGYARIPLRETYGSVRDAEIGYCEISAHGGDPLAAPRLLIIFHGGRTSSTTHVSAEDARTLALIIIAACDVADRMTQQATTDLTKTTEAEPIPV